MSDIVFGVRLKADGKEFAGEMRASEDAVRRLGRAAGDASAGTDRLAGAMQRAGHYAAGLVGIDILSGWVKSAISTADAFTRVESRLRLVTGSVAEASALQSRLFDVAQQTRQGFLGLADVYAQVARASAETGVSQSRLIAVTQTLSQAVALSGGSAESTRAALVQLSQGLASGTLRGEELNSVMEQTPRLAQAIAQGMGVGIGELRKLAEQGALTSEAVIGALERAASGVQREFSQLTPTVGDAFTQLGNSGGRFIDVLNDALGVTDALAGALQGLSRALDAVSGGVESASRGVRERVDSARQQVIADQLANIERQLTSMDAGDFRRRGLLSQRAALEDRRAAAARDATFANGGDAVPPVGGGEYSAAQAAADKRLAGFIGGAAVQSAAGKRVKDQTELLKSFAEAVKGFAQDSAGYQQAYAALMQGLANIDAKAKGAGKSAPAAARDELQALQNDLSGLSSDFQKNLATLAKLGVGTDAYREAVEKLIQQQPFARDLARDQAKADAAAAKAREAATRSTEAAAEAADRYLQPLEDQAAALEHEAETYGKTAAEIQRTAVARLEEARAMAVAAGAAPENLANLEREIAARRRIAEASAGKEVREANDKAAKEAAEAWDKISSDVAESLTDAILQGGSDGWELLARQIRATVIRATIVPFVQGGINSVLQGVGLGPGGGGASGGGMPSFMPGVSAAGLISGGASLFAGTALGSFGAGLASGVASFGSLSSTAATMAAGASTGGAVGSGMMLGSVAPYALAAYAILDAAGVFKGPTPHRGGAAFAGTDGSFGQATAANTPDFGLSWGAYRSDRSAALDASVSTLARGVSDTIASLLDTLGAATGEMTVLARFAADNDDASVGALRILSDTGEVLADLSKKYSKDGAKGFQQFADDSQRAILAALQAAEGIDPAVAKMLSAVDPMKAAITDVTATLTRAADWIAAGKQLEDAIYQAFTPPADMLADVFEGLSTAIPDSAEAFEALTRAQDLNTEAGRAAAAQLLQVYPLWQRVTEESTRAAEAAASAAEARRAEEERALQQQAERNAAIWERTRERAENAAKAMRGFVDELAAFRAELTSGALAGLSPEAAYRAAQTQFDRTSREAQLGNHAAIDKLDEVSRALLQASQAYYAGSAGYFADRDRVLGAVDATLGVAARQSGISVPRFAEGGLHAGGLRLVGERGPELEITGPARYLNATDTRAALTSNGSREVVTELRAVVRVLGDGLSTLIEQGESHDARLATLERGVRLDASRPRAAA